MIAAVIDTALTHEDAVRTEGYRTVRKRLTSIHPSPENQDIYRRVIPTDPDIIKLAESIEKHGLQEPLIVTLDNCIVSGHRRYMALKIVGQVVLPCRVIPVRRSDMSRDEYVAFLRENNRQRNKSVAEQVREELIDIDPESAYRALREQREPAIVVTR